MNNGPIFNDADERLTISAVSMVEAREMSLIEAVLVPDEGPTNGARYPQPPEKAGAGWPDRVPAEGAVLQPGDEWWFVVGLAAEGPTPSVRRFQVDYVDESGQRYRARTGTSIAVRPKCIGVEIDWPEGW
ncbi:hypothetical protein GCM10027521_18900 [Amycolatopsis cihanbeyliensis]